MTARKLAWDGVIGGLFLIGAWFAATRTTFWYAYRGGSLSQVQGLCDSGLGRLSRALSAQGAAECSHIDSVSANWNITGFAGLLLAVASAAWLVYQAQHKPQVTQAP